MDKKCTLLATALLTVGSFVANAANVPATEWKTGSYYYLTTPGDSCLALDGNKTDSVVVVNKADKVTKAAIDSALWQISNKEVVLGVTTYKFTNKATNQVLSFAAKAGATPNLAAGVDKWVFAGGGTIKGFYAGNKTMELLVSAGKLSLAATGGTAFTVEAPAADFVLNASQLGNGFSVFQLVFGDTYEGNLFAGKEIVAKDLTNADAGYVSLQVQGDLTFPDNKAKYFGVDTLKTTISSAANVYGAKFAQDSTYAQGTKHTVGNADFQKFKFMVNLKNDSLIMLVKAAPNVNATTLSAVNDVRVVYAQNGSTKVLTVSKYAAADYAPEQGGLPLITSKKGTPATIPTGTGVYFLKNANKANIGKYIVANRGGLSFMGADSVPTVNLSRGQWYIKEANGKYSVVDRQSNTTLILDQEIFAVQGMADTYVFGNDSITVSKQSVNLNNKFLGSLAFTNNEMVGNGYVLNLIPGTPGVSNLYAYATDSVLKAKVGDGKDASIFKLIPNDTTLVGGAQSLGDKLYVVSYKLRDLFKTDTIAQQTDSLKFSTSKTALPFSFISNPTADKYAMMTAAGKYVGMNITTSCVQLVSNPTFVTLEAVDAPEYAAFASGHKRLTSDAKSLTMNPLNFFAELKSEGQEMLKANYDADHFSLWVEQAANVAGKQLYLLSSGIANAKKTTEGTRYYLAAARDSAKDATGNIRALFITSDTIKTMKNNPALFAFKTAEEGGFYLENQSELNYTGTTGAAKAPYVGNVNGFAVMQSTPVAAFTVEGVSAPTANDKINTSEVVVVARAGEVVISNASGRKITLSNILGQTISSRRASSDYFTIPASTGIVLVTVEGDATYKVIVK